VEVVDRGKRCKSRISYLTRARNQTLCVINQGCGLD
jgi:hypothetical protein